jgi:hypothetical protein
MVAPAVVMAAATTVTPGGVERAPSPVAGPVSLVAGLASRMRRRVGEVPPARGHVGVGSVVGVARVGLDEGHPAQSEQRR